MKKFAICLYGQPRKLYEGYHNINSFLKKFENIHFDFYYHTWYDPNLEYYEASNWRYIHRNELKVRKNVIEHINKLYKPINYQYEKPIKFDVKKYENTLCYKNSNESLKNNMNNFLSQLYSRTKVRDLLINKDYDFVIMIRFDFLQNININLYNLDISKIYVSNVHHPRKIFADGLFIMGYDNFMKIFNIYDTLSDFLDSEEIMKKIGTYNEKFIFNPEELFFSKILYEFGNIDNVIHTNDIPFFFLL